MKFKAKVVEVIQETPRVKLVRFGLEQPLSFRAGQWVGVWSEDYLGENSRPLRRAFSIASLPTEKHLELCVARGERFSAFLQDSKVGQEFWIDGPYGMFWLKPAKKYLFIAGGTGIAPFRSMIHQALAEGKEVLLIYSIRTPSDFVYRKELESIKNKHFKMVVTITMDAFPNWTGEKGRIQNVLKNHFKEGYAAYVCGPVGMVEAVETELINLHQHKDSLFIDKWE